MADADPQLSVDGNINSTKSSVDACQPPAIPVVSVPDSETLQGNDSDCPSSSPANGLRPESTVGRTSRFPRQDGNRYGLKPSSTFDRHRARTGLTLRGRPSLLGDKSVYLENGRLRRSKSHDSVMTSRKLAGIPIKTTDRGKEADQFDVWRGRNVPFAVKAKPSVGEEYPLTDPSLSIHQYLIGEEYAGYNGEMQERPSSWPLSRPMMFHNGGGITGNIGEDVEIPKSEIQKRRPSAWPRIAPIRFRNGGGVSGNIGEDVEIPKSETFTESGYASAPNLNGYSPGRPSTKQRASPASSISPTTTKDADNDETMTLFSAGTQTTIAPTLGQNCIVEICSEIYDGLGDVVDANTWPTISKKLPNLIKAFAIKLGSDSTAQVNREIMYFLYKRHGAVVARLDAMFSHDIDVQCRSVPEGLSLPDKMALWQSKEDEDVTHATTGEDCFEGVVDDEDDSVEEIHLPAYRKVMSESQAYQWFLSALRNEALLQREGSRSHMRTESVSRILLEKLPTGAISKRHSPSSHEVTFVLDWDQSMKLCKDVPLSAWPAKSFGSFVVLTGSPMKAQALTTSQYMRQTWPTTGVHVFNLVRNAIACPKGAELPTNSPNAARISGSNLEITATGPAYFIAECGEQIAWLAAVLASSSRDATRHYTPSIESIHVQSAPSPSSGYRGRCEVALHMTHMSRFESFLPGMQNSWQAVVGRYTLIEGFPISRRLEGYPGLEVSWNMLLYLMQAQELCILGEHISIKGPEKTVKLAKQTSKICLWHPVDSTTQRCFCDQILTRGDISSLELKRHILGSCIREESQIPQNIRDDPLYAQISSPEHGVDSTIENDSHHAGDFQSQSIEEVARDESIFHLPTSQHEDIVRSRSSCREIEYRVSDGCLPTTEMELTDDHGYFEFVEPMESGDEGFDTDQLSISDASDDALPLNTNDPLYPILISVLDQLLLGFRSLTQHSPSASATTQRSNTSTQASRTSSSSASGAPSQIHLKRKLGKDDGDDGDQDDSQRPPRKIIRRNSSPDRKKVLACPYFKKDPKKHRQCGKRLLKRIRDVKQHLTRAHTSARYCQRCHATFQDDESMNAHIYQCDHQDSSSASEVISYQQHLELARKSKPSLSEPEQWFVIWDILFPNCRRPISAYIDPDLSADLSGFLEYCQIYGPAMLTQMALSITNLVSTEASEDLREEHLRRISNEGMGRLIDAWTSRESADSQLSTDQRNNTPRIEEETPQSFVDSAVALGSQALTLEVDSQSSGIAQSSRIPGPTYPPAETVATAEVQTHLPPQDIATEVSQLNDENLAPFTVTADQQTLGHHQGDVNDGSFEIDWATVDLDKLPDPLDFGDSTRFGDNW